MNFKPLKTVSQYIVVMFALFATGESCSSPSSDGMLQLQCWIFLSGHIYIQTYMKKL